jgi:tetratricopeptide (TPR) repeat protein
MAVNGITGAEAGKTKMTPQQALQAATSAYGEGQMQRAETIVRSILASLPEHAGALHLLGIISFERGQRDSGIELVRTACARSAGNGQFLANLAELCRRAGRLEDAIDAGERAVAAAPLMPAARANLGIAYFDKGNLEKAEACQRRALELDPRLPTARNNLGSIYRERKELGEAIACYRQVLADQPAYLEAASNLGSALTENEQPEEALKVLEPLVAANPSYPEAISNLGSAYAALDRVIESIACYERALKLRPNYPEATTGLARMLQECRRLTEARAMAQRAAELRPNKAEVHAVLGGILSESGYPEQAASAYARALQLDPHCAQALMGRGHLQMELGHMQDAEMSFHAALAIHPDRIGPRLPLVQLKKIEKGDSNLEALEREARGIAAMPSIKATPLHFALGKCYEDLGDYDTAFKHYAEGCRLKRATLDYSAADTDLTVRNIMEFFTPPTITRLAGSGCRSELPIFVLGMPRSGTTLTETILASHPMVHGAGELPDLLRIAATPGMTGISGYPLSLKGITQAEVTVMGQNYVDGLRERSPQSARITDKMPANFNAIGLIHVMLPNARIVHVQRDPVDTCLSNFTKLFGRSQPQSYDLVELGRYYLDYALLMDHWRAVLPAGAFYEIQYEDLVEDPASEVRKLLDYCRLEWDDACMNFHETERSVKTASITQVRRPMYKTSVQKWRRYEKHLGPLLDTLGDLVGS